MLIDCSQNKTSMDTIFADSNVERHSKPNRAETGMSVTNILMLKNHLQALLLKILTTVIKKTISIITTVQGWLMVF